MAFMWIYNFERKFANKNLIEINEQTKCVYNRIASTKAFYVITTNNILKRQKVKTKCFDHKYYIQPYLLLLYWIDIYVYTHYAIN